VEEERESFVAVVWKLGGATTIQVKGSYLGENA
jgi:hypothetical protein